jgi:DNA-nicking Smr family endonuclease
MCIQSFISVCSLDRLAAMKKPQPLAPDEAQLFRDAFGDVRPLAQDKITLAPPRSKKKASVKTSENQTSVSLFYFSDQYEGYSFDGGTVAFVQAGDDPHLAKNLKRGDYQPAVVLDLHGLSQQDAKVELAGLLDYCQREHFNCACIVHGKGSGLLARKVPNWLIQHPNVRAFHTAPTHWGRDGALLVLLKTPD